MSALDAVLTGLGIAISAVVTATFAFTLTLAPCPTEDSTFCYWNANQRSNGQGISFIALNEGFIIPLENK